MDEVRSNGLDHLREFEWPKWLAAYLEAGGGLLPDWLIRRRVKIEPFTEVSPAGVVSYGLSAYGYDLRADEHFKVFHYPTPMRHIDNAAAAWLAGIIDGEGHVGDQDTISPVCHKPLPRLTVGMTDERTVNLLAELTGVGQVYMRKPQKAHHKPCWIWEVRRTLHVQQVLLRLLPYLVTKKAAAQEIVGRHYGSTGIPIVDPVALDERCFETVKAKECIIPPNSFALAVSVERLEIPRELIGLVVDKSTYRRCGIVMGATVLEPEWRGRVTLEITNTTPLPARVHAGAGIAQVLFFKSLRECDVSYADKKGRYQDQDDVTLPFVRFGRDGQDHCQNGHPRTPENTYEYKGRKKCRLCQKERDRRYRAKKKEGS